MNYSMENSQLTICLDGKITAANAPQLSKDAMGLIAKEHPTSVVLDASSLEYISSAGLRAVVNLAKSVENITIQGASPEVHEVFYLTGLDHIVRLEEG